MQTVPVAAATTFGPRGRIRLVQAPDPASRCRYTVVNPPNFLGTRPDPARVRAPGMRTSAINTRLTGLCGCSSEAFTGSPVNLGLPNGGFSAGPDGRNQSAACGTIVSARDARIIQFGLKLIF